jgi:protein ImuB
MKRALAIWLPNWPLQRLLSSRPELKGEAVILEGPSRRGQAIAACSREARRAGVYVGMPTAEAIAILTHNPTPTPTRTHALTLPLPYDGLADRKALAQLAQWCHRYSPTAGLEESETPETLLLDATSLAPLYGSEELLVSQVVQGLRRLGLDVRAALAATVGAAWALAHYGGERKSPTITTGEQTRHALAPLPIAALRLPNDLLETLTNLGAQRIADLLALPREQLRSRFGPLLLTRIDQALGAAREVFAAVDPPEEFVVEQMFEFPLSQREALEHVVETLLGRLAWMLAARCAGALRVACRFDCEGAPATEFEVGFFQPTAHPRHLLEIVELEMERLRLRAPAIAVSIRAAGHAPLAERQGVLFDQERNLESSLPLAALVNRLAGRLGRDAVVRCRLERDAQPELAYAEHELVDANPPAKTWAKTRFSGLGARSNTRTPAPLDRPLYLLRRPAALETLSSVIPDGPPIQFRRGGRLHVVARQWGPERIETGWWRGQSAWRDYYRIETTEGRRFWLFRRRRDGRWFLHGLFG